ncbi:MAG: DegT/DnrJ/EryC1/StrS aminotransferase family protein [Methanobacteriota archaeon]
MVTLPNLKPKEQQKTIPLFQMYADETDVEAVTKVIRRQNYWATGEEITKFEQELARFVGRKYAVVFNSGTSALHALFLSYNIKPNDEVIVPSFTFVATANTPLFVGAKPVFADIEGETYGLDVNSVKQKITNKTKVIMPIHYGGCACKHLNELKELAQQKNILFFEDAAQSLGAEINNKKAGSFGEAAIFSFCQDKMITTGEGGVVVTDNQDRYEDLKLLVSHGRADDTNYFSSTSLGDYIKLGYNFRMPSMNAALGLAQLHKIHDVIQKRRNNAQQYTELLKENPHINTPQPPPHYFHVYQKYTINLDKKRDELQKHLTKNHIITKAYFGTPVHLTSFYRKQFGYKEGLLPVTEHKAKTVLSIPMFPGLSQNDLTYVANTIMEFYQ